MQYANALLPIEVTELPIVTSVSGHPRKAYVSIEVTEFGIITSVSEHPQKAIYPIEVTVYSESPSLAIAGMVSLPDTLLLRYR